MKKQIKVLHLFKTSLPQSTGGIEVFIDTLCSSGSKLNIENTVLSLAKDPAKSPVRLNGYFIHQTKLNLYIASTGFSFDAIKKFKLLAQATDIVHYHFPNPFADILHFLCSIKKPSIVTYHSDILKQKNLLKLYAPLMKCFLKSVNKIVATSPKYIESSETLNKFIDKTTVVPIGIDTDNFPKISNAKSTYWKKRIATPFFLFVGALRYYKGLHYAIKAMKGIKNAKLIIAGDSQEKGALIEYAKQENINNIEFVGFVSNEDKVALLKLCTAFIFPSHLRTEAFGISLLEAASLGKPMISCEIGTGTSYVNIHQKTGLVVKPASSQELAKAMQFMLKNEETIQIWGANAKKRVEKLFTAEYQVQSYRKLYESIICK